MADIATSILEVGSNRLILQDAEAREKINEVYVTDTASGSIASFPDGADNVPVKSLKVNIEPVQSGSGDPSPDNVRPISGHTQAVVTRTGKNWFDSSLLNDVASRIKYVTVNLKPNTQYTMSSTIPIQGGNTANLFFMLPSESASSGTNGVNINRPVTLTTGADGQAKVGYGLGDNTVSQFLAYNFQIEVGSTATEYNAYSQPQTVTIDLGGTRYGGTLDVTTGVLTVDMAMFTISDLLTSTMYNTTGYQNNYTAENGIMSIRAPKSNSIIVNSGLLNDGVGAVASSYFGTGASWNNLGSLNKIGWTDGLIICAKYDTFGFGSWDNGTDALTNTEKTAIASAIGDAQIVWKLTTPLTIQLSAQEVRTLLGTNNIWADCGDVTAEYRADTKLYIQKVMSS